MRRLLGVLTLVILCVGSLCAADSLQRDRGLHLGLHTNMLYDLLAVPNVGADLAVGNNLSVKADWMYGWWSSAGRHRYWRICGGDLGVRYWLGRAAGRKQLQGHHLGLVGQVLTYDFEFGGRGWMGGKPGGSVWDRMHWGVSAEYGYSLPVGRRLNIDFSLALGYLSGTYHEYKPVDGCNVWQSTKRLRYFGPTGVAVSLVWLIGRENHNAKSEGRAVL